MLNLPAATPPGALDLTGDAARRLLLHTSDPAHEVELEKNADVQLYD